MPLAFCALRFAFYYASLPLAQPDLWAVLHMDLHGSGGRTEPVRAVRERRAGVHWCTCHLFTLYLHNFTVHVHVRRAPRL